MRRKEGDGGRNSAAPLPRQYRRFAAARQKLFNMNIYSNELSHKYSELRGNYTATDEKTFSILNKIGVRDKRILDFGCGDGRYAFHLAELGASEVVGIDVSPAMIEIANRELQNRKIKKVKFLEADGNNLTFGDNSFDIVFSNFVIHHFEKTLKPLQEIFRVLDKNGYFLGTFNTAEIGDIKLFNTEIPLRLGKQNFVVVHNFIKSDNEVKQNFEKAGLKVLQYQEEENPFLSIEPTYPNKEKIGKIKTIICLAQKI